MAPRPAGVSGGLQGRTDSPPFLFAVRRLFCSQAYNLFDAASDLNQNRWAHLLRVPRPVPASPPLPRASPSTLPSRCKSDVSGNLWAQILKLCTGTVLVMERLPGVCAPLLPSPLDTDPVIGGASLDRKPSTGNFSLDRKPLIGGPSLDRKPLIGDPS